MGKTKEPTVFIANRESTCGECGENLGHKAWITLNEDKGAVCLVCADLDHLVFLPSGDTALTRRAKKHSGLYAVVLKWSRPRKRYERQGLLVEEEALERAGAECEQDAGKRALAREMAAIRREELDQRFIESFAQRVCEIYPFCPREREHVIARHACAKYSGRVGRSASAKDLEESAVRLAVTAHVRHAETDYDELLLDGHERHEARQMIQAILVGVLAEWEYGKGNSPE